MPFVLDASMALSWCFEDEATAETDKVLDRLGDDHAIVPPLWESEITNALLVAERKKRLNEAQSTRFVSLLAVLPINVDTSGPPMTTLLALGRQHGLSSYDATYLALAERAGIAMATLDEKLRAAAHTAGVALLG
jgi:predicted nucleic acid-binding protein